MGQDSASQCRECGFNPWSRNQGPTCGGVWSDTKKKKIAASLQSQLLTAGVAATIKRPGPAHSPVTPVPLGFQHSSIEEPAGTVKFFHFTLSVQVRKNPR